MIDKAEITEKILYIKRFINQMEKTFNDAKTCSRCNESCGDVFYNRHENVLQAINFIENETNQIFKEIEEIKVINEQKISEQILLVKKEYDQILKNSYTKKEQVEQ